MVVVYDARTGDIRHIHEEINLAGAQPSYPEELVQKAMRVAQAFPGRELGQVRTLVIDARQLHAGQQYRVDVDRARRVPLAPHGGAVTEYGDR